EHGDRDHQFDQRESGLPLTIKHHLPRNRGQFSEPGFIADAAAAGLTTRLIGVNCNTVARPSVVTRWTFARSNESELSPLPIASISRFSSAPSPEICEPAASVIDTISTPFSLLNCVIVGGLAADANRF